MLKKRILAATVGILGSALMLSGCAFIGGGNDNDEPKPPVSQPSESEEGTENETPSTGSDEPSEDITAPGSKVGLNEWITYEYTGLDDQKALISARLVSVEKATAAQQDLLITEIPKLEGYTVYIFRAEEKKLSGDSVVFEADYTDFSVASADGSKAQEVTVIGWEDCENQSFTEEFDTAGATLEQCFVGAVKDGGAVPTGIIYAPYDGDYDYYDGQPILLTK